MVDADETFFKDDWYLVPIRKAEGETMGTYTRADIRAACADAGVTPGLYRRSGDSAGSVARYDRSDYRAALRAAATAMGEPLTERAYQDWRAEQSGQTPSPTLFTPQKSSPYESWSEACRDAGVETHGAQPQSYSTADIRAAILEAMATRDDLLRMSDYKTWREEQLAAGAAAIPSVTAICYGESAAFESWKAARLDALLSEHFEDEAGELPSLTDAYGKANSELGRKCFQVKGSHRLLLWVTVTRSSTQAGQFR